MTAVNTTPRRPSPELEEEPTGRDLHLAWPWWLHPALLAFVIPSALTLYCLQLPESVFDDWGVRKALDEDSALRLIFGASVFAAAILLASWRTSASPSAVVHLNARQIVYIHRAAKYLFALTLAGYGAWVVSAVTQGATSDHVLNVLQFKQGAVSALKRHAVPVAGVTTLTQLGPVVVALTLIRMRIGRASRSDHVFLIAVIALAVLRSFLYAERLALIEVLGPALVIVAVCRPARTRRRLTAWAIKTAPLLAFPVLWGVFAIFEYSRSWLYYRTVLDQSFSEYVTTRVSGYYVTAVNNSAIFEASFPDRGVPTIYSLKFAWNFPGSSQFMHGMIGSPTATPWWHEALSAEGNPEYNNPGSFLVTAGELGTAGMIIYWAVLGVIVGRIYRAMRMGMFGGLLATALSLIPLLELPRIIYWVEGRAIPVWIACFVVAIGVARRREQTPSQHRAVVT